MCRQSNDASHRRLPKGASRVIIAIYQPEAHVDHKHITLIDRGRGLQLSNSRITVQDLVPYFQEGFSYAEIMRWMPTLTHEEIALVETYYQDYKEELDEEDRRIRAYVAEQVRLQRLRIPEEPQETRLDGHFTSP